MNLSKRYQKWQLSLPLTLLAAVLLAGCVTLLALWCQPNALRLVVANLRAQPLLIVLNAMPIGLLILTCTCLFRNVFWGTALVNLFVCGFSIANRIKIEVRDEPLFPRDFTLLKEVGTIVGEYEIPYPVPAILAVVITTLALAVCGIVIGCKPFSFAKLRGWWVRFLGAAASFGVLVALILTVYASNDLYNSFRVSNAYYIPSVFNELGFPYCFCHQFTTYPIDKPDGFDKGAAITWDTAATNTRETQDVHVVMVMNEAFADLTNAPAFCYTEESDPLPNLHALQQDAHAITGDLVVPGFAGGTANTEFDVMTGMQTNALAATGNTSAMRVVNRNLDSLFRLYGDTGYRTSYFHPGDDWFYNRENVLRWLGAKETVFLDQMTDVTSKGRWVTDDYMAGLIEQEFEQAVADEQLLFHYTTTIQNHMSYTAAKYGEDYSYPPLEASTDLPDDIRTMLEVYMEGARDADAMLGRLVQYFSTRQEPVVLVFFGDHLPYLGENQAGYGAIGSDVAKPEPERADALISYEVPYVIWANNSAADTLDWDAAVDALEFPENGRLSSSFLGVAVAELTGHADNTPWFAFLDDLRRQTPVVQKKLRMLPDGAYYKDADLSSWHAEDGSMTGDEILARLLQWRQWSYYKLRYKDIP